MRVRTPVKDLSVSYRIVSVTLRHVEKTVKLLLLSFRRTHYTASAKSQPILIFFSLEDSLVNLLFACLADTLLKDEESARDNHVFTCNFAKYLPIKKFH